jgi:tRNA(His) guanylyltransferase
MTGGSKTPLNHLQKATMSKDSLGDRIKRHFEHRCRHFLPRRSYVIIRIDGRAFHTFTRHCKRPFDEELIGDMNATSIALCDKITGAQFAFVQSDEVSALVTDFQSSHTEAWFDNSQSKTESLSASIATAAFNKSRMIRLAGRSGPRVLETEEWAEFDSRAFLVPDVNEVANVFIWRQQDASRNSVQMVAQAHFSHHELEGKSTDQMQERLWQERGINWNDFDGQLKRGRFVEKQTHARTVEYTHKESGRRQVAQGVERNEWVVIEPPIFTQNRAWLMNRIPTIEACRGVQNDY